MKKIIFLLLLLTSLSTMLQATEYINSDVSINDSTSLKGIHLVGKDAPIITRKWDVFTSGAYDDVGRWGLFMLRNQLGFGIPNRSGKSFSFRAFNADSTSKELLKISQYGDVYMNEGDELYMKGKRIIYNGSYNAPNNIYLAWGEGREYNFFPTRLAVGTGSMRDLLNTDAEFVVKGKIKTQELEISAEGWADFVFEDDYDLKSLDEVESFIEENGHLPEIPSADEVMANGVNVGQMNTKLLQKVEELTLYMIKMNKENAALTQKIEALENAIQ